MLDISVPAMIGHLHLLWWWALDFAEDGELAACEAIDLAEAAMWEGDPEVFVEVLATCGGAGNQGFIERDDDGPRLHDWAEYAGRLVDRRAKDRDRKRTERAVHRTSDGHPADGRRKSGATVPNRTGPEQDFDAIASQSCAAPAARVSEPAGKNGSGTPEAPRDDEMRGSRHRDKTQVQALSAETPKKVPPHQEIFGALCEVFGVVQPLTKAECRMVGAVAAQLAAKGLSASDVLPLRNAVLASLPEGSKITMNALAKYASALNGKPAAAPANGKPKPGTRAVDRSEIARAPPIDYAAAIEERLARERGEKGDRDVHTSHGPAP